MKSFILLLSLLIIGKFCSAQQSYILSGMVKDKRGEALPGAGVYVSGYKIATISNNDGTYTLPLKPGNYDILVQLIGYKALNKNIIISDKAIKIDLVLEESITQLNEVTIKPDPNFAKNRMIYWAYSEPQDKGVLLAIAKGKLAANETTIENQTIIYRATPAYGGKLQYGSRIVFDKNGNLFVSTGERSGNDIRIQAQYLNSSLGKILHLTTDGKAVANGPFAGKADAKPEIYAYGLRNPDGLAINPLTGDLWEAEFGPKGGDEVNIIKPGKNYGWPIITYGTEYSGKKVGDGIQQKEGMEQPVYYWNPSISPGCIAFYNSNSIAEWKGNLFVGGLGGSHIIRLVIKDDKIVSEERLLEGKGERFRDMVEGKDGALYSVTDNGHLFRIAKK